MAFNYQHCTTRNAVETSSKIWITLVSIFNLCRMFFWNETLDQTTTRKGFSTRNQIEISYYIVLFQFVRIIVTLT